MVGEVASQINLTSVSYFLPLVSFLVVFIIVFAVLQKTKIFESKWLQLFVAFLFSTIFVSFVGARDYVINIVPWFAVLVVCLFLLFMITGFVGKDLSSWNKGLGIAFVIFLIIVFVVSALFVFSGSIAPYLPGGDSAGADSNVIQFTNWAYSSRVAGGFLLLIVCALVSWVLVKAK